MITASPIYATKIRCIAIYCYMDFVNISDKADYDQGIHIMH